MANFIVIIKQLAKPDYLLIPPTDTAPQFLENLHLISFAYFILWLLGVVQVGSSNLCKIISQNNKPTEVVYDASNCLVLLYTVNNLLYE